MVTQCQERCQPNPPPTDAFTFEVARAERLQDEAFREVVFDWRQVWMKQARDGRQEQRVELKQLGQGASVEDGQHGQLNGVAQLHQLVVVQPFVVFSLPVVPSSLLEE
jgi:hypothetical protein